MDIKTVEIEGVTYGVLEAGKPVVIHDDGKEVPFDIPATYARMSTDGRENTGLRTKLADAEKRLKAFDGIEDPDAARKALETVVNLDQKKLIDAGEVEKVKADIAKAYDAKLAAADERTRAVEGQLYAEKIGGAFARSKVIADKCAIPAPMVEAYFGKNFKIEDGKVIAYGADGRPVLSRTNPADPAGFEEALETLISADPNKDAILRGQTGAGGGAGQGGGATVGPKTMKQSEFNALSAKDRAAKMAEGYTLAA